MSGISRSHTPLAGSEAQPDRTAAAPRRNLRDAAIFSMVLLATMTLVAYLSSLFVADEGLRLHLYILVSPLLTLVFHRLVSRRSWRTLLMPRAPVQSAPAFWLPLPLLIVGLFFGWGAYRGILWNVVSIIEGAFVLATAGGLAYILARMRPADFRWAQQGKYLALGLILPAVPYLLQVIASGFSGDLRLLQPLSPLLFFTLLMNALFYFALHSGQLLREELTFRGYLTRNLARRPVLAIFWVGVVFGLWHVPIFMFGPGGQLIPEAISPGALTNAILISLLEGSLWVFLYLRTGNLLIPALSHSMSDTVRDMLAWAPVYSSLEVLPNYLTLNPLWLGIANLIFVPTTIYFIVRLRRQPPDEQLLADIEV